MPCLVALPTHWAMKGNSTWIRWVLDIHLKKYLNTVIKVEWL